MFTLLFYIFLRNIFKEWYETEVEVESMNIVNNKGPLG
jgi:hypothetical protein